MKLIEPTHWEARIHCVTCGAFLEVEEADLSKVVYHEVEMYSPRTFVCCNCGNTGYIAFPQGDCCCIHCMSKKQARAVELNPGAAVWGSYHAGIEGFGVRE